jgi:hypothetical protein
MNDADMLRIHDASGLALNVNKAFTGAWAREKQCEPEPCATFNTTFVPSDTTVLFLVLILESQT